MRYSLYRQIAYLSRVFFVKFLIFLNSRGFCGSLGILRRAGRVLRALRAKEFCRRRKTERERALEVRFSGGILRAGEFAAGRNLGAFCVFECGFYAFCCQNFFYMLL